jgi:hypothetical protein
MSILYNQPSKHQLTWHHETSIHLHGSVVDHGEGAKCTDLDATHDIAKSERDRIPNQARMGKHSCLMHRMERKGKFMQSSPGHKTDKPFGSATNS